MQIVIAEDQLLLREGIAALLRPHGVEVVATAGTFDEAVAACLHPQAQAAIMDIRMPPLHQDEGLRASVAVRRQRPGFPVLLLSQYVEQVYVQELLDSPGGGIGYLLKDRVFDDAAFAASLREVAGGSVVLDPQVIAELMERSRAQRRLGALTARELEVLGLMAKGLGNGQIAAELFVTEKAVAKHINSVFTKLELPPDSPGARRVEAVLAFLMH